MRRLILQARGIDRVFRAGDQTVQALRGVNLALHEGDFAAILGPPGAGKSTLLHILGFLDIPTAGDLFYQGRLVTQLDEAERELLRASGVALVPGTGEAIARALSRRPTVLLVDDPIECTIDQLIHLHRSGLTILLATDLPETAACTLTIYEMRNGTLRRISGCSNSHTK